LEMNPLQTIEEDNISTLSLRETLERDFLPYVIKPSRFVGCEWSAGNLRSELIESEESAKALIVLARMATYESSVNDPTDVALANSLTHHGNFRVGRYYMFDSDTEKTLQDLGIPEFVIPQLVSLKSAEKIYFSIKNWPELIRVVRNLKRIGISPNRNERNQSQHAYPQLICISPTETVPKLADEIFDKVIQLGEALGPERISPVSCGICLLPESPLTPTTEIANYRNRMILSKLSPPNASKSAPANASFDALIEKNNIGNSFGRFAGITIRKSCGVKRRI